MDQEYIANLRDGNHPTNPGLPLVLYLDLPQEKVEEWQLGFCTVIALNRRLSTTIQGLLNGAAEVEAEGLQDEAARAIMLLAGVGVDQQAFILPLLEALAQMDPDAFAGINADATTTMKMVRDARQRAHEARNTARAHQEAATPPETENSLPSPADVIAACENIIRQNGEPR